VKRSEEIAAPDMPTQKRKVLISKAVSAKVLYTHRSGPQMKKNPTTDFRDPGKWRELSEAVSAEQFKQAVKQSGAAQVQSGAGDAAYKRLRRFLKQPTGAVNPRIVKKLA
jgi:hypothetical protein